MTKARTIAELHYPNKAGNRFDEKYRQSRINSLEKLITKQLILTDVGNCPFEAYAVFCIECDRKGIKPIKHKDYLNLG